MTGNRLWVHGAFVYLLPVLIAALEMSLPSAIGLVLLAFGLALGHLAEHFHRATWRSPSRRFPASGCSRPGTVAAG